MNVEISPLRLTLRVKLLLLNLVVAAALCGLAWEAWRSSALQQEAQARQVVWSVALQASKQADMIHDALRGDVLTSLLAGEVPGLELVDIVRSVGDNARALDDALRTVADAPLSDELAQRAARLRESAQAYAGTAAAIVHEAGRNRSAARAALADFERQFKQLLDDIDQQGRLLEQALRQAQAQAGQDADQARGALLWALVATIALASSFVAMVTTAIRRRLRRLSEVAQAIADGDLSRRARGDVDDELGELAGAVDRMASSLSRMIDGMRADAQRAAFGKQLAEALDMADRELQVCQVATRAMAEVSPDHAMELLIADSSRAQMERAAEHPTAGAPGCAVNSPYDCVAVRRGAVVAFRHSDDLNACDQLRARPGGCVSATCVPVTFMGRAIGVLHAAGAPQRPLDAERSAQLATLGVQLGMRIGTVRAFEKTQIQAATDSLTGLANRRTLEQALRKALSKSAPFAVVLCDLDHFKKLNDTYGHAAGDAALRQFADVLRQTLRDSDVAARWGGEEFTLMLPGADARTAAEVVERLRSRLAATLRPGTAARFTASFGIADSTMARRLDILVNLADAALYQAKTAGRDRACLADPMAAQEVPLVKRSEPSPHGIEHDEEMAEAV